MNLTSSLLKLDDNHSLVHELWTKRNHVVIPKDYLTDYGVMVSSDDTLIAGAWLFPILSSKTCMIRFPISNIDIEIDVRDKALDLVFQNLHSIAKDMGYTTVFITTNHANLKKRLLKYSYMEESKDCSHFWGEL